MLEHIDISDLSLDDDDSLLNDLLMNLYPDVVSSTPVKLGGRHPKPPSRRSHGV